MKPNRDRAPASAGSILFTALTLLLLAALPSGAQTPAGVGAGPAAPGMSLDEYYRYPLGFGAEYQGLTAFSPFASGFAIRDIAAELRVPVPPRPSLQPFLRLGVLTFTQSGSAGDGKWDHAEYYGALGLSYAWRFARNFELGLEASGGLGQSVFPSLVAEGPVGSLDILASAGARIGLVPLFNLAVDIRPVVRYMKSLGPLTEFDGFSFGVGFSVGYRFGEDPDSPAALIRSLRFGSDRLPAAYAAMQSYYAANPLGTVLMTNTEGFPLTDVEVSFFQPGYMDSPTPVQTIPVLDKGVETRVDILAAFNQEIFRTEGTTPLAGELIVRYKARGRPVEQRLAVSYDLYDRTSITWDDDRKVGAFITPADSALRNYVSFVRQAVKDAALSDLNGPLQTAAQVWAGLSQLGIIYQADPTSPFTRAQGNNQLVDSINVARDTLKRGTGDCDDLTVLFASLLETTGVETGFMTVPGHIYAAFNTRVPARDFKELHPDRTLTVAVDGELWVPVEITLLGKQGFMEAWRRGAELWRQFEGEADKRRFIRTAAAQQAFRPVVLREADLGLQYGNRDSLVQAFRREAGFLADSTIGELAAAAKASGDKKDLNSLGVAMARFGRYADAEGAFGRALKLDPGFVSAHVNLGNVAYLRKDYRRALASYRSAESALAAQGKSRTRTAQVVLVSMSRAYLALQSPDDSRATFAKAQDIDPVSVREFGYLAQVGAGSGASRAAEQSDAMLYLSED